MVNNKNIRALEVNEKKKFKKTKNLKISPFTEGYESLAKILSIEKKWAITLPSKK